MLFHFWKKTFTKLFLLFNSPWLLKISQYSSLFPICTCFPQFFHSLFFFFLATDYRFIKQIDLSICNGEFNPDSWLSTNGNELLHHLRRIVQVCESLWMFNQKLSQVLEPSSYPFLSKSLQLQSCWGSSGGTTVASTTPEATYSHNILYHERQQDSEQLDHIGNFSRFLRSSISITCTGLEQSGGLWMEFIYF